MIGETPIFHVYNDLESSNWFNHSKRSVLSTTFRSHPAKFRRCFLILALEDFVVLVFFLFGGRLARSEKWEEWNKKHLLLGTLKKVPRFWKVEFLRGATSRVPPNERETGNLFFYTHSMYPYHGISKTTVSCSVARISNNRRIPSVWGGWRLPSKYTPELTANWPLQIGQAPTGNDMVFKPSNLRCKLAVRFREGNTNDLLFKDSLHIANICRLGNVWNFECLFFHVDESSTQCVNHLRQVITTYANPIFI